jgi:hypothetical protein
MRAARPRVRQLRSPDQLALLLALILTGWGPRGVAAQTMPIVLTVQLRSTIANTPVPGIAVRVVDAASDQVLAQGTTDARGQVRFPQMPPTEVRVRLTGTLPDGTALRPTPQDTEGIWVKLPGHDWLMELRADTDGLVFPELSASSAGAPDAQDASSVQSGTRVGGTAAAADYPTALLPPAGTWTTVSGAVDMVAPTAVLETSVSRAEAASPSNLPGAVLFALLIGMSGGVLWLTTRHKL